MGPEGHSFRARRGTDVLRYPSYQMFGILAQRFAELRQVNRQGRVAVLSGVAYLLLSSSSVPQESGNQGADTASGQLVFNNSCRTCHSTKEGDNRLGPHLEKIIGRKAGSLPNFGYSSAMKGAGFVWDEEKLERFIANPDEIVPGNSMKPYGGLVSADSRAKVIAFLKSLTTGQ
jgi:cytochrome c